MKRSILALLLLVSLSVFSQNLEYEVSSYVTEGTKAPNTHYIGEAWLNAIIHDDIDLGYNKQRQLSKPTQRLIGISMAQHKF